MPDRQKQKQGPGKGKGERYPLVMHLHCTRCGWKGTEQDMEPVCGKGSVYLCRQKGCCWPLTMKSVYIGGKKGKT